MTRDAPTASLGGTAVRISELLDGEMRWMGVGQVVSDGAGLVFPQALPTEPAVYRWLFPDGHTAYIGQCEDLRRHINGYKNPGPSQRTNHEINAKILASAGPSDPVQLHTLAVQTNAGVADLTDSFLRKALENLAVIWARSEGMNVLNK